MSVNLENIRKVAVKGDGREIPQFISMDMSASLKTVVKDICSVWGIKESEKYSLKFDQDDKKMYITEKNRKEIKNGDILKLEPSHEEVVRRVCATINKGSENEKELALELLTQLSSDITFSNEFIQNDGHLKIIEMIESGNYASNQKATSFLLRIFVELMDLNILSWDILSARFVKEVVAMVTKPINSKDVNVDAIQSALDILESVVMQGTGKHPALEQLTLDHLTKHLQSQNVEIPRKAMGLINAIFQTAEPAKQKQMAKMIQSKSIRPLLLNLRSTTHVGTGPDEMSHQLYVLQQLLFNLFEERMRTPIELNDQVKKQKRSSSTSSTGSATSGDNSITGMSSIEYQKSLQKVNGLLKVAFDSDTKDYRKLGFKMEGIDSSPLSDFVKVPPGALALDNMLYFSQQHAEDFTKIILEYSCRTDQHDFCPFAQASIAITLMICEVLNIGDPPSMEGKLLYNMFFNHEHPIEELFCYCVSLWNKTWKEMKAATADFDKVSAVVREQMTRSLNTNPNTFEEFRKRLKSYTEITEIWQQERQYKEEGEKQAAPVVELREMIKPDIVELVKQNRLNFLVEGSIFPKYNLANTKKMKDRYWCCRLTPNHKALAYGDCTENHKPSLEQLPEKVLVVDIKAMEEINFTTQKKNKQATAAFKLLIDQSEPLQFVTGDDHTYQMWLDGLNALTDKEMTSDRAQSDLDTLLNMEIKLRLLDTEGVEIPNEPPPIPPEPPNYDFAYLQK